MNTPPGGAPGSTMEWTANAGIAADDGCGARSPQLLTRMIRDSIPSAAPLGTSRKRTVQYPRQAHARLRQLFIDHGDVGVVVRLADLAAGCGKLLARIRCPVGMLDGLAVALVRPVDERTVLDGGPVPRSDPVLELLHIRLLWMAGMLYQAAVPHRVQIPAAGLKRRRLVGGAE